MDVVEPLFAAGVDGGVAVEELEVLEPLMLRRFGGGGGAALAPRLEELGESSRVEGGTAAAAALFFVPDLEAAAAFGDRAFLEAVEAVAAAFGFGATTLAAGFAALGFRRAGFLGSEVVSGPTFLAPEPPSLSASLTAIPRQNLL
ncbi:MAG: hypothetical protein NXI19_01620 [Alphaproteobacteria bacterium]|nr:hypothetical protein [Alphaproteobacteria bacterium]